METGRRHNDLIVEELINKIIKVELDLATVITEVEELKQNVSLSEKHFTSTIHKMEIQINKLSDTLLNLIKQLDDLVEGEKITHALLDSKVASIQEQQIVIIEKLEQLSTDLVEPMEVYKTAKYGMKAGKIVIEVAKYLLPFIAGLLVAWHSL